MVICWAEFIHPVELDSLVEPIFLFKSFFFFLVCTVWWEDNWTVQVVKKNFLTEVFGLNLRAKCQEAFWYDVFRLNLTRDYDSVQCCFAWWQFEVKHSSVSNLGFPWALLSAWFQNQFLIWWLTSSKEGRLYPFWGHGTCCGSSQWGTQPVDQWGRGQMGTEMSPDPPLIKRWRLVETLGIPHFLALVLFEDHFFPNFRR